ncbi:MAG: zf-HC2 domain-containing protein [Pseudomonadota bacterium]|jgi:anti-sigma factor RsiW
MSCAESLRTQAFIDGEIDGAEAESIERHIESCPECQAVCADAALVSDAMRAEASRYAAPESLRRRVQAALALDKGYDPARAIRLPRVERGFWSGLFSGAGVTALAAGVAGLMLLPPSAATLADAVVQAHTDALMRGREITVVSTDHHTVKPWFAGRIALSPPVVDFAAEGFKLVGGRLDKAAGAPAAVVVYRHGGHAIDLFVWADRGAALPAAAVSHGYRSIFWKRRDLDFAAVSDTSEPELAKFVQLVQAEPE